MGKDTQKTATVPEVITVAPVTPLENEIAGLEDAHNSVSIKTSYQKVAFEVLLCGQGDTTMPAIRKLMEDVWKAEPDKETLVSQLKHFANIATVVGALAGEFAMHSH